VKGPCAEGSAEEFDGSLRVSDVPHHHCEPGGVGLILMFFMDWGAAQRVKDERSGV